MEDILERLNLSTLSERFLAERIEPETVMAMTDVELNRYVVTTFGDRLNLRTQCREAVKQRDQHTAAGGSVARSARNLARDNQAERDILFNYRGTRTSSTV